MPSVRRNAMYALIAGANGTDGGMMMLWKDGPASGPDGAVVVNRARSQSELNELPLQSLLRARGWLERTMPLTATIG